MNLLFDFGGVLVDLDKECCRRAFAALGFDIMPYLGTYAQAGFFSALERGELSVHEFCTALRQAADNPALGDDDIVGAWREYLRGVPRERLEMLLRIGKHYPVYALSNTNPVHWDMAREDYFHYNGLEIDDFFRKAFLSYEMGMEKPAPGIFEAVVSELGCRPDEILFLDDSAENCEAARACGLQARLAPAGGAWLSYFTPDGVYIPENLQ